jgi:hypothetical protein
MRIGFYDLSSQVCFKSIHHLKIHTLGISAPSLVSRLALTSMLWAGPEHIGLNSHIAEGLV